MIKTSFKIVFKTLWKNKTYSLINIIGLAIGMSTFIIGLLYLNHEWSYDKGFKDYKDIYRIQVNNSDGSQHLLIPETIAETFEERIPEIEKLTKFSKVPLIQPLLKENDNNIYIDNFYFADSSFFKIFNFPFVYGNIENALSNPNGIVLSKKTSAKLFQNINPIGKTVLMGNEGDFTPLLVTAVFDDKKFPTHLSIDAVRLMEPAKEADSRNTNPVYTYVKLNPKANSSLLEKKLTSLFRATSLNHSPEGEAKNESIINKTISLKPLVSIYLHSHVKDEISKRGNETSIWLISCLITFMLIVSAVNFTNLNIAEVPSKAKEIAVRRILGSSKFNTLKQLYLETLLKCIVALILAVFIVELILPELDKLLQVNLSLFINANLFVWFQIISLLIIIVLITGTYPVLFITYFKSSAILKGNFINSLKGNQVRNTLLVIQFMITSVLIVGVFIISAQFQFLRNKNLGFDPNQIIIITPGKIQTQFKYPLIKNQLLEIPGIQNISYASAIGNPNEQTVMHLIVNGHEYTPQYLCVDTSYFNLMGAKIINGRNFSTSLGDSLNSLIINQTLANKLGIRNANELDEVKVFRKNARIIGIVNDMNFYGFENKIPPMAFTTKKITLTPFILLKLNAKEIGTTIEGIKKQWKGIEPEYPLRYKFFDQSFQEVFDNYETINKIFTYFTICALFIAMVGLFSITALITFQRSKEIAIRKVLGASVKDILKLINKKFVELTLIANMLAWPIIYLLSEKWLDNFAYRIKIPLIPFVFATIISLSLTVFIVSIQSFGIALLNPTTKLKQE